MAQQSEAGAPGGRGRRGGAAEFVENVLIGASIPALWLWFLKRQGYPSFQGWWVEAVLVAVLVTMLVVLARRLSRWASLGWRCGPPTRNGRE
jgi:hypothetical protein